MVLFYIFLSITSFFCPSPCISSDSSETPSLKSSHVIKSELNRLFLELTLGSELELNLFRLKEIHQDVEDEVNRLLEKETKKIEINQNLTRIYDLIGRKNTPTWTPINFYQICHSSAEESYTPPNKKGTRWSDLLWSPIKPFPTLFSDLSAEETEEDCILREGLSENALLARKNIIDPFISFFEHNILVHEELCKKCQTYVEPLAEKFKQYGTRLSQLDEIFKFVKQAENNWVRNAYYFLVPPPKSKASPPGSYPSFPIHDKFYLELLAQLKGAYVANAKLMLLHTLGFNQKCGNLSEALKGALDEIIARNNLKHTFILNNSHLQAFLASP